VSDLLKELRQTAGDAGNGLDRESRAALDEAAEVIEAMMMVLRESRRFVEQDPTALTASPLLARINEVLRVSAANSGERQDV
jgi:hypothetical protein